MIVVVGLGNPGRKYAKTKHNVGFMVVDALVRKYNFSEFRNKYDYFIAEGRVENHDIVMIKPATYMNLSGNVVKK